MRAWPSFLAGLEALGRRVLEDDFPAKGPRATYRVDILAPCW